MICARCDRRIKPGEDYVKREVETGSGAAPDIYLHVRCQPDPATQPDRYPDH
jgi:hypothetical protein